ncbi:MAG: hypothetical protein JNM17_05035 [Archangium sp.]|nr:hypothetical protein [Archangium sp.]
MATRTLTLPSWMNVVLEGGGLELERAALDYARLTTLLRSDWKQRALELSNLITDVTTRELAVVEAEERARKRAATDPDFQSSLGLTRLVKERRSTLAAQLGVAESDLCVALDRVREEADEAAQLVRAWHQFALERSAWSVVLTLLFAAAPVVSYFVAREQGGVRFDLGGILDSAQSVLALLFSAGVGVVSRARLGSWDWLHDAPINWTSTFVAFAVLLLCLPLSQVLPAFAGGIALGTSALQLGGTLIAWRRRSKRTR